MDSLFNYSEFKNHVLECLSGSISKYSLMYNSKLVDNETKNLKAFLENKNWRIELNTIDMFPYHVVSMRIYSLKNISQEIGVKEISKKLKISREDIIRESNKAVKRQNDNEYQFSLRKINSQLMNLYEPFLSASTLDSEENIET
jgi:hypothetical protein